MKTGCKGKRALVAGGSSGLNSAINRALADGVRRRPPGGPGQMRGWGMTDRPDFAAGG